MIHENRSPAPEHLMKALTGHLLWIMGTYDAKQGRDVWDIKLLKDIHQTGFDCCWKSTNDTKLTIIMASRPFSLRLVFRLTGIFMQKPQNCEVSHSPWKITTRPTHLPHDLLYLNLDSGNKSFPFSKMAALLPWRWVCWIRTIPHHPIIWGILIARHTLSYISIISPFCCLMKLFQCKETNWGFFFQTGGTLLFLATACAISFSPQNVSSFPSIVRQQVKSEIGWKSLNVGNQILGHGEMKETYFKSNVLFICLQNRRGTSSPQARPTSLTCGVCGCWWDAVIRLSVFSLLWLAFRVPTSTKCVFPQDWKVSKYLRIFLIL